jgi:hypothetical protein
MESSGLSILGDINARGDWGVGLESPRKLGGDLKLDEETREPAKRGDCWAEARFLI